MVAAELRDHILDMIREYVNRPDVKTDLIANEVLNCLAGDIEVLDLDAE